MDKTRDHFNVEDLYTFTIKVLRNANYSKESAQATAYALLEADKRGIFSHGIAGGTGLEEAVKRVGITATGSKLVSSQNGSQISLQAYNL